MDDDVFSFRVGLSEAEYLVYSETVTEGRRRSLKRRVGNSWTAWREILAVIPIALGAGFIATSLGAVHRSEGGAVVIASGVTYFLAIYWPRSKWRERAWWRAYYRTDPGLVAECSYTIDKNGVASVSEDGEGRRSWRSFRGASVVKGMILLWLKDDGGALPIPLRVVGSPAEQERFLAFIKSAIDLRL